MKRYKVDLVHRLNYCVNNLYRSLMEIDEKHFNRLYPSELSLGDDWLNKTVEILVKNMECISPYKINEYTKDQWLELVRCIDEIAFVFNLSRFYADSNYRDSYFKVSTNATYFLGFALKYIPKPYELDKETDNET